MYPSSKKSNDHIVSELIEERKDNDDLTEDEILALHLLGLFPNYDYNPEYSNDNSRFWVLAYTLGHVKLGFVEASAISLDLFKLIFHEKEIKSYGKSGLKKLLEELEEQSIIPDISESVTECYNYVYDIYINMK